MEFEELLEHEIFALIVLAKYVIHLDNVVSKDEVLDLMSLGEAIGMDRFNAALDRSQDLYKNVDAVVEVARTVQRYDAKVLVFVLLEELIKGDGAANAEGQFLVDLQRFWEL